jgi:hypothetical protein
MEHLDGNIRTRYRTQGASGAFTLLAFFVFRVLGWMVAHDIELVADPNRPFGTGCNTQPTALAQLSVDPNKSLFQGSTSKQHYNILKIRLFAQPVKEHFFSNLGFLGCVGALLLVDDTMPNLRPSSWFFHKPIA